MKKILFGIIWLFLNEYIVGQTFIRPSDGSFIQESKSILPKTRRSIKNVENGILVTYEFDYMEKMPDEVYTD